MVEPKIIYNPEILKGKPIISGTRISVELIMDLLAGGLTVEQILAEYPHLTRASVFAAISFAKSLVQNEDIYQIVEKNGQVVFANA